MSSYFLDDIFLIIFHMFRGYHLSQLLVLFIFVKYIVFLTIICSAQLKCLKTILVTL